MFPPAGWLLSTTAPLAWQQLAGEHIPDSVARWRQQGGLQMASVGVTNVTAPNSCPESVSISLSVLQFHPEVHVFAWHRILHLELEPQKSGEQLKADMATSSRAISAILRFWVQKKPLEMFKKMPSARFCKAILRAHCIFRWNIYVSCHPRIPPEVQGTGAPKGLGESVKSEGLAPILFLPQILSYESSARLLLDFY